MSIHNLLQPLSIAIIGASKDPKKIGNIVVRNLQEWWFTWDIFPINLDWWMINGLQTYTHCNELPTIPDLCIISLPVTAVLWALQDAIAFWCTTYIIFTAWFKEIWPEGALIEQELISLAKKTQITLLWPNCLWCFHQPAHMNATFAKVPSMSWNLRIISQSGAIVSALCDRAQTTNIGFESCLTIWNKAVLNENHLLEYRVNNQTSSYNPIGLYLEQISDGKTFVQLTEKLSSTAPVILLKPGKSLAAQHAMQSHTWSIAGDDDILNAACFTANIIRTQNIQQFFDLCMYCSRQPAPKGKRIALITNAWWPWVITTDLLEAEWLITAQLSETTKAELAQQLPRASSVIDPIDILGDAPAQRYRIALQTIFDDEQDIDAIMIILTPQVMTQIQETAEIIAEISRNSKIPIVGTFIWNQDVLVGKQYLRQHQIPCYDYPHQAVYVLSRLSKRYEQKNKKIASSTGTVAKNTLADDAYQPWLLDSTTTTELLRRYGVKTPHQQVISSEREGQKFLGAVEGPIVLKAMGKNLVHKIDQWWVITWLTSSEEFHTAWQKMQTNFSSDKSVTYLIQEQITQWIECIVWLKQDKSFWPALIFWSGGTLTELLQDHTVHLLPHSKEGVYEIVINSPLSRLLQWYRGAPPKHIPSLVDTIRWFVCLIREHPTLHEAEINPLIVTPTDTRAVDPKLIFA